MATKLPYQLVEVDPRTDACALMDIMKMQIECFPEDDIYLPERGWWWIVYCRKQPAAFAGMVIVKDSPEMAYFPRAGVLVKHRGLGMQRSLIDIRILKAEELGLVKCITTTYDNPQSGNNLIRCGFKLYEPVEGWGREGTNYWMASVDQEMRHDSAR